MLNRTTEETLIKGFFFKLRETRDGVPLERWQEIRVSPSLDVKTHKEGEVTRMVRRSCDCAGGLLDRSCDLWQR